MLLKVFDERKLNAKNKITKNINILLRLKGGGSESYGLAHIRCY